MHNALDLASMLLLGVARMFGGTYLALAGIGVCLWAIHLVMVQPPAQRDETGWAAQTASLVIALPLFVVGCVMIVLASRTYL